MYYILFRYSGKRKLEIAALPDAVEPAAVMAMGNQTAMVLDIFASKEGAVKAYHAILGTGPKTTEVATTPQAQAKALMDNHKLTEERVNKAVTGLAALSEYLEVPYADDMLAYLRRSLVDYHLVKTIQDMRALVPLSEQVQIEVAPALEPVVNTMGMPDPGPEYFTQEFEMQPEPTITEAVEARPLTFAEKLALRKQQP